MDSSEEKRVVVRFGEEEAGPEPVRTSACAVVVLVFASIVGILFLLLVLPNVLQKIHPLVPSGHFRLGLTGHAKHLERYARAEGGDDLMTWSAALVSNAREVSELELDNTRTPEQRP